MCPNKYIHRQLRKPENMEENIILSCLRNFPNSILQNSDFYLSIVESLFFLNVVCKAISSCKLNISFNLQ